MSSAAEAELGALFLNAKTAVSMRQTLTELGHPQPLSNFASDLNNLLPQAAQK